MALIEAKTKEQYTEVTHIAQRAMNLCPMDSTEPWNAEMEFTDQYGAVYGRFKIRMEP